MFVGVSANEVTGVVAIKNSELMIPAANPSAFFISQAPPLDICPRSDVITSTKWPGQNCIYIHTIPSRVVDVQVQICV